MSLKRGLSAIAFIEIVDVQQRDDVEGHVDVPSERSDVPKHVAKLLSHSEACVVVEVPVVVT
jgi:hypothetical protein